jgi:hypothetical protein
MPIPVLLVILRIPNTVKAAPPRTETILSLDPTFMVVDPVAGGNGLTACSSHEIAFTSDSMVDFIVLKNLEKKRVKKSVLGNN